MHDVDDGLAESWDRRARGSRPAAGRPANPARAPGPACRAASVVTLTYRNSTSKAAKPSSRRDASCARPPLPLAPANAGHRRPGRQSGCAASAASGRGPAYAAADRRSRRSRAARGRRGRANRTSAPARRARLGGRDRIERARNVGRRRRGNAQRRASAAASTGSRLAGSSGTGTVCIERASGASGARKPASSLVFSMPTIEVQRTLLSAVQARRQSLARGRIVAAVQPQLAACRQQLDERSARQPLQAGRAIRPCAGPSAIARPVRARGRPAPARTRPRGRLVDLMAARQRRQRQIRGRIADGRPPAGRRPGAPASPGHAR